MDGWVRATPRQPVGGNEPVYGPRPFVYTPPGQVFDYHQARDNRWNIKKVSSKGACQGLSIFWVIQKANGVDYLTWLGPPRAASSQGADPAKFGKELDDVVRVMKQQDKIFNLPNGTRDLNMKWATDRICGVESGGGSTTLQPHERLALLQGATPKQIAAEVTRLDGYIFFGFSKTGWGGHAVAAYVNAPVVEFFDPNYGEYLFQDVGSFHTWFETSLMANCYGFDNLTTAEIQHFR